VNSCALHFHVQVATPTGPTPLPPRSLTDTCANMETPRTRHPLAHRDEAVCALTRAMMVPELKGDEYAALQQRCQLAEQKCQKLTIERCVMRLDYVLIVVLFMTSQSESNPWADAWVSQV